MRLHSALLLLLLLACQSSSAKPRPTPSQAAQGLPTGSVVIVSSSGERLPVHVEIAADEQSRETGLMYRRSLGADDGMLFIFPNEEVESFWMKNTLIPLDMVFIRTDGTIVGIVPEATPQSVVPRSVGVPSRHVLEVNGGWCQRKGVKKGDKVLLENALPKK